MLKLTLITIFMMLATAAGAATPEIVIASGTELPATNNAIIDSSAMKIGDEVNFTLSIDVKGTSGLILKGSVIYGRVVDAENFGGDKGGSKLVVMFDFLQVAEEFYSMSAIIASASNAPSGLQMKESDYCEGCTAVTLKGADFKFPAGTAFKIRVAKDVER